MAHKKRKRHHHTTTHRRRRKAVSGVKRRRRHHRRGIKGMFGIGVTSEGLMTGAELVAGGVLGNVITGKIDKWAQGDPPGWVPAPILNNPAIAATAIGFLMRNNKNPLIANLARGAMITGGTKLVTHALFHKSDKYQEMMGITEKDLAGIFGMNEDKPMDLSGAQKQNRAMLGTNNPMIQYVPLGENQSIESIGSDF